MKRSVVAALGAAIIVALGASSAAQAAIVSFDFGAFDGSIQYTGTSLDVSTALDLDQAFLLVMEVNPGDSSGLAVVDEVKVSAVTSPPSGNIIYGSGTGPQPLGADVILSWPLGAGPGADAFTETLATVKSIDRSVSNEIDVSLTGTLSDTKGLFTDSPVVLMLHATQDGGSGFPIVTFSNMSTITAIPEASTWAMMALGFVALGYVGFRRRKANLAVLAA
jgi:hypothetical protein